MFIAIQAKRTRENRHYGYTCQWRGRNKPEWLLSDWCGWYRHKRDAAHRADILNVAYVKG